MKHAIAAALALLTAPAAFSQLLPPGDQAGRQGRETQVQQQQGAARAEPEAARDSVVQSPLGSIPAPQVSPEKSRHGEQDDVECQKPCTQPDAKPDYLAIWTGLAGAIFGALAGAAATIHIGRRQARAAEEANVIARASSAADVRWNDISLVYSSFYDGENSLRATIRNYGSGVASIEGSVYTVSVDGVVIQTLVLEDVSGVLGPTEKQTARFNFSLDNGAGARVHDGTATLAVTCEARFIAEGKALHSKSSFVFDRGIYAFRQKACET